MDIQIDLRNKFNMPKGVSEETIKKGLLWIERKKQSRVSKEFPDGWITRDEIIAEGMRQGSDVWPLFWHDDTTIRDHYLHNQANYLAGCYKATIVYDNGTTIIHPQANVIVRAEEQTYFTSPMSLSEADLKNQVLEECVHLLKGVQSRLARIQQSFVLSANLIAVISKLIDQIEKVAKAKARKEKDKRKQPDQPNA